MSIVSGTLDKASGFRPGNVPVGKSILLLLLMGFPGKFTTKAVRYLMGLTGKIPTDALYKWSNVVGPIVAYLEAYGFGKLKFMRNLLGDSGLEALKIGLLTGAIDAGWNRMGMATVDRDLSDIIGDETRTLLVKAVRAVSGGKFGAMPEAGSSAWREQQRWLASPQAGPGTTASPVGTAPTARQFAGPSTTGLGAPQVEADPVQIAEEVLAAKSRL